MCPDEWWLVFRAKMPPKPDELTEDELERLYNLIEEDAECQQ
jgi:hypothetical protein